MDSLGSPKKKTPVPFSIFNESDDRATSTYPCATQQQKLDNGQDAVDELLAKITQQREGLNCQGERHGEILDNTSSTPTDPYANTPPNNSDNHSDGRPDAAEVFRLKKELEIAQERLSQMNLELTQSRIAQHTVEEAIGSPFPGAQRLAFNIAGQGAVPSQAASQERTYAFNHQTHPANGKFGPLRVNTGMGSGAESFNNMPASPKTNIPRSAPSFGNRPLYQSNCTSSATPLQFQAPYPLPNGTVPFQQPPIGTRMSPTLPDVHVGLNLGWNGMGLQHDNVATNASEPLNYRRLLDRTVSCNWKFIVDKIVCNNDQQASIFLQQKLKTGTSDQKFEIVQAIIDQAYPLMVNRFGNFLVQRCFEHGALEQVVSIAQAIRGNTLNLSMDAFGCHVVQKAFDCVPEEYKAIMVHELLRRIPETVIHRYACHVWQKLFELRWSGSPPQIMKYVNEALRGMWHEVALGETGSLVVQNIFENCLEEDKRPCINEVLSSIDVVAHGQFGNWCIQHICEHGAMDDRVRAVDHILRFATEYSTDQFASKVVEKCLKIGGTKFLDRYLERLCEPYPDRPRMPLIDIAGDQFGNYLIQYILTSADPQRREVVAVHVRKHMVSLRGSKYGSRVAMLCCNPAVSTRPGPPVGLPMSRSNSGYFERVGPEIVRTYSNDRPFSGMGRGGYNASFPR